MLPANASWHKKVREAKQRRISGYPPAEGGVEHSQRDSSQENYVIFSLDAKKRATEDGRTMEKKREERKNGRNEEEENQNRCV